ncbi:MAG: substrate-binding domain-containing protein [Clostridia bacterium]
MKKVLAIVLCLALVLGAFAGCGGGAKSEANIAQFVFNFADPQQGAVKDNCEKIYKDAGVKFMTYDAGDKQAAQTDQLDTAISKGATLLVVGMKDNSAAANIAAKAKKAGIPLVFYNNEPAKEVVASYDKCWFVGTAPRGGGEMQGEMAANFILKDFAKWDRNGDGYINYVMVRADLSQAEANGRTEASKEVADKMLKDAGKKGLKQIGPDYLADDWSTKKGLDQMSIALTAYPISEKEGVELVFCNNDGIALGVMQALQAKGWCLGGYDNKFVPIVGVDATVDCKVLIDAEKILGSAGQPAAKMAKYVTTVALNVFNGKEPLAGSDFKFETGEKKLLMPYDPYPAALASK